MKGIHQDDTLSLPSLSDLIPLRQGFDATGRVIQKSGARKMYGVKRGMDRRAPKGLAMTAGKDSGQE